MRKICPFWPHSNRPTKQEEINNHLRDAGIEVVDLKELERRHSRFKSFVLTLKKSQLPLVENPDLWPEGVVVRPYFRPCAPREDGNVAIESANPN